MSIITTVVTVLCTVYGKKPTQKQKDHREQLLANHKPVEQMAGRRMVRRCLPDDESRQSASLPGLWWLTGCGLGMQVGMLKMIRNLAFAHRSQHVQQGRFNTEDEVFGPSQRPHTAMPCMLLTVLWHAGHRLRARVIPLAAHDGLSGITLPNRSTVRANVIRLHSGRSTTCRRGNKKHLE